MADQSPFVTKRFTQESLEPMAEAFGVYRKTQLTRAVRIDGPFEVLTREGLLFCPDGWLAIDSGGWPYPIAHDEFLRIYEEVVDDDPRAA